MTSGFMWGVGVFMITIGVVAVRVSGSLLVVVLAALALLSGAGAARLSGRMRFFESLHDDCAEGEPCFGWLIIPTEDVYGLVTRAARGEDPDALFEELRSWTEAPEWWGESE